MKALLLEKTDNAYRAVVFEVEDGVACVADIIECSDLKTAAQYAMKVHHCTHVSFQGQYLQPKGVSVPKAAEAAMYARRMAQQIDDLETLYLDWDMSKEGGATHWAEHELASMTTDDTDLNEIAKKIMHEHDWKSSTYGLIDHCLICGEERA